MDYGFFCKSFQKFFMGLFVLCGLGIAGCTTNPATGEQQFTGLMSPSQEKSIGAEQHQEIIKEYGGVYNHPGLQAYVNEVGQRVAKNTERADVTYRFTLLDSPVVNAFALPGGYVYITRGILAVANDEDELAAVLGHEIGHVTARHQASRYSQGMLTALGATIVGAVVGDPGVSQALSLGTNLYMSSYSRDQESQADDLGIRYLVRAGYDQFAMANFLNHMDQYDKVKKAQMGKKGDAAANFLSTHPVTAERVSSSSSEAAKYQGRPASVENRTRYLAKIRGMTYGDSITQGFVRDGMFYHPDLGFAFSIPAGYDVINQPDQVVAKGKDGSVLVMDMAQSKRGSDPVGYLTQDWLQNKPIKSQPERILVNGMSGAALAVQGMFNNAPATLQLIAINWRGTDMVRFQIVLPTGVAAQSIENLKRATYSFRGMREEEKRSIRPTSIQLALAKNGESVASMASRMHIDGDKDSWFRAINGLGVREPLVSGVQYKIVQ